MDPVLTTCLGSYREAVESALARIQKERVIARIRERDHTVWKPDPTEIANRLGWLRIAEAMASHVGDIVRFGEQVRRDGLRRALLLGMGGSSLAPEVMRKAFGVKAGYLDLAVLDSTDPGYVLRYAGTLDPWKTLFIVATKSGGTAETLSGFKYFYNRVLSTVGGDRGRAGSHFVAITDEGSQLDTIAREYRFRRTFLNDRDIGGRYSALSCFGLVPAALAGIDIERLRESAAGAARLTDHRVDARENAAARLGATLGELALAGRDKLTFISSPPVAAFEDWAEQLVAESTGKEGKGILPVVAEPPAAPGSYGDDRVFVYLALEGDHTHDRSVEALERAGLPVVRMVLGDLHDMGGAFFVWELATAVAGHLLGINPFDQPDVESAKVQARAMIGEYQEKGALPEETPALTGHDVRVFGATQASQPGEALVELVNGCGRGGYVAFHAYLTPSDATYDALQELRTRVRDSRRVAATIGYGPRFLHSTGQLHKGDGGRGVFVQFSCAHEDDAPIPDRAGEEESSISFGVLKDAQALGDRRALEAVGRRVLRFHFLKDPSAGILDLARALG